MILTRKNFFIVLVLYFILCVIYPLITNEKNMPFWAIILMVSIWIFGFAIIIKEIVYDKK